MRATVKSIDTPSIAGAEGPAPLSCSRCGYVLQDDDVFRDFHVCGFCSTHHRESARATIARLVDEGSFRETNAGLVSSDPLHFEDETAYSDRLRLLLEQTGESDAIVTGFARIGGKDVAIAALDFGFLGGSMGVVVGEKLVRLAEKARDRRCPLITISASGGARMQEGMLSLLQMAKTSAAVQRLREEGCPYLSILANPTTGGVFASFANLGDVIVAEPGALIGFAGPRVAEQVIGGKLPPGTHTSEFLREHGMVDAIIDRREQRLYLERLLTILAAPRTGYEKARDKDKDKEKRPRLGRARVPVREVPAWETVQRARAADRMTSSDFIQRMLSDFVELHGDRSSGDDPAVIAGVGTLGGNAVAIIGLERGHGAERAFRHDGRPYPEGYRKARRVMDLAERLGLPLVTLIDTPGAYPGIEAEERGLAAEIAGSLARMSRLRAPIVTAIIGEGGSGGALALAVADRVLMLESAIYSVIAPEGAATILYRDVARAPEVSAKLKLTAAELLRLEIVDEIVPEAEGNDFMAPDALSASLATAISSALASIQGKRIDRLVKERYNRYQQFGRTQTRRPRSRPRVPRFRRGRQQVS